MIGPQKGGRSTVVECFKLPALPEIVNVYEPAGVPGLGGGEAPPPPPQLAQTKTQSPTSASNSRGCNLRADAISAFNWAGDSNLGAHLGTERQSRRRRGLLVGTQFNVDSLCC